MEAEADNTDIDAARSIDSMLDDGSGDVVDGRADNETDSEIDTPLTPDMATRSQPPASSPIPFSPSPSAIPPRRQSQSRRQSTHSRQPIPRRQRQSRQPRRDLDWDSGSETETLSDNTGLGADADTEDTDTEDAEPRTVQRAKKTTLGAKPKTKDYTKTNTSTSTEQTRPDGLSRSRPHRQADAVTDTPRKTVQAVQMQSALDANTTEDIPPSLPCLAAMPPMDPIVARPRPAKTALTVQLKVNLEIEVVIKARICGDVLLSVL